QPVPQATHVSLPIATTPIAPAYAPPAPPPAVRPAPQPTTTAPAQVAKAPAPAPAAKPAAPARDASGILIAVVAEKTGYPADMLGPDMALDTAPGIDSTKRVEIPPALQERTPDPPPVKPEHLGTLHTLRDIANFLGGPTDAAAAVPPLVPAV